MAHKLYAIEQTQLETTSLPHRPSGSATGARTSTNSKPPTTSGALEAKTRAEATTLLGEVEADDDDAFHRSVEAFRSAVDHGLDALGAKDKQSVWDEIYRPIDVHRDTLVEDVTARLEPAASKERTATGAVKEWTKEQMERRPVRVTFKDRGAATQRS